MRPHKLPADLSLMGLVDNHCISYGMDASGTPDYYWKLFISEEIFKYSGIMERQADLENNSKLIKSYKFNTLDPLKSLGKKTIWKFNQLMFIKRLPCVTLKEKGQHPP
jgi:hypothetical protein